MGRADKFKKIIGIVLCALVLILVAAAVAFKIYASHYYAADKGVIEEISADEMAEVEIISDKDGTAFVPKSGDYRAVIAFYPGGKVEYRAYDALMYELASRGFVCLLVRMPENIALLGVDVVDKLIPDDEEVEQLADSLDWYMAGHSLGGTAASKYLADHFSREAGAGAEVAGIGRFKGLILCGSYPSYDLSGAPIRMLSVYGSNDGVLNMEAYENARAKWPADSTEVVLDGGIHSYFGSYGIQSGDGEPTITNEQQIEQTADIIDEWID